MQGLIPDAEVIAYNLNSIFGVQIKPPHIWRDPTSRMHPVHGYLQSNVVRDEASGYLLLAPQNIPLNTVKADWTFDTASNYLEVVSPHTGKKEIFFKRAGNGLLFNAETVADLPANPCFFLPFSSWPPPHDTPRDADHIYRRIEWPYSANTAALDWVQVDDGGEGYTECDVTITGGGGSGATAHALLHAGVVSQVVRDNPGSGYTTVPSVVFSGDGSGAKATAYMTARYRLSLDWGFPPRLEKTTNFGADYFTVDEATALGSWETLWHRFQGNLLLTFFTLDDVLEVYFGDVNSWAIGGLRYRAHSGASLTIPAGTLRVYGRNGMVRWGYYPVRWPLTGYQVSPVIDAGFSLETEPNYKRSRVFGALKNEDGDYQAGTLGSDLTITASIPEPTDAQGAGYLPGKMSYRYRLNFAAPNAGDGYASSTPLLKDFTIHFPGISSKTPIPLPPLQLTEHLLSIQEAVGFDLERLTVQAQYVLTFSNRHGEFRTRLPECAIEIMMGWKQDSGAPLTTEPLTRRILGRTGLRHSYSRPGGPVSTYSFTVMDRSLQLRKARIKKAPYLDGTYHAFAVGWLAEYGGLMSDWMADDLLAGPADGVPLLPVGIGAGTSSLPLRPGLDVWAGMHEIRRRYGHMLFFDRDGVLRYYPFIPSVIPAPMKGFYTVETPTDPPVLDQIWSLNDYSIDLEQVRNNYAVLGYSIQDGLYIAGHYTDWDSVFNPAADNYTGMVVDWVDADQFYTSPGICQSVLAGNYAVYRWPVGTCAFGTWGQPRLFPMHTIAITEDLAVPYGQAWTILGMNSSWTRSPLRYTTTLHCRNVTPLAEAAIAAGGGAGGFIIGESIIGGEGEVG